MIITIDMVTGEVSDDSVSQHVAETGSIRRPEMRMPRNLEPGLQTYDSSVPQKPVNGFPDSMINSRIDTFIDQMNK
ncbi:MAG: hypothetical protein OEW58_08840 [Gammaproteobacteria bacterium]|nr:hypothetical protein [Gammaproteobacteria bacterium]